jgi:hypothetical protein
LAKANGTYNELGNVSGNSTFMSQGPVPMNMVAPMPMMMQPQPVMMAQPMMMTPQPVMMAQPQVFYR